VERLIVFPLANLVASGQVGTGDLVMIDLDPERRRLTFIKGEGSAPGGEQAAESLGHFPPGLEKQCAAA
jgi:hypothetical protein